MGGEDVTEQAVAVPVLLPVEHDGVAGADGLALILTGALSVGEGGVVVQSLEYLLVHRGLTQTRVEGELAGGDTTESRHLQGERCLVWWPGVIITRSSRGSRGT